MSQQYRILGGYEVAVQAPAKPRIVCLVGSMKFYEEQENQRVLLTLLGHIVLVSGGDVRSQRFKHLTVEELAQMKTMLDELHFRKIDLADEVLVVNVNGYVGESTQREIAYAQQQGKPVRYLEPAIGVSIW